MVVFTIHMRGESFDFGVLNNFPTFTNIFFYKGLRKDPFFGLSVYFTKFIKDSVGLIGGNYFS